MKTIHNALCDAILLQLSQEPETTAKEIADYLDNAAKGMRINSAFNLVGANLAAVVKGEYWES